MGITNDILAIVLSSTVLAGIISTVVSYIVNQKNNNLKYITEDRRKWREEIKGIVDELEETKKYKSRKVIEKLKVRINPYGQIDGNILHDAHIWDKLYEMENAGSNSRYMECKEQLIIYLSLLLKFDWEKSKKEVLVNLSKLGLILTIIIGLAYIIYIHFFEYGNEYNDLFLLEIALFLLIPIIIGQGAVAKLLIDKWNIKSSYIKQLLSKLFVICCVVSVMALYIFLFVAILQEYDFDISTIDSGQKYLDITIVMGIMILIYEFTKNLTTQSISKKYVETVIDYINKQNTNHQ